MLITALGGPWNRPQVEICQQEVHASPSTPLEERRKETLARKSLNSWHILEKQEASPDPSGGSRVWMPFRIVFSEVTGFDLYPLPYWPGLKIRMPRTGVCGSGRGSALRLKAAADMLTQGDASLRHEEGCGLYPSPLHVPLRSPWVI